MKAIVAAMAALVLAPVAQAQTAPKDAAPPAIIVAPSPAPAPVAVDAEALKEARKLIGATRVSDMLDRMFKTLAPVFAQGVIGVLTDDQRGQQVLAAVQAREGALDRLKQLLASEYLAGIQQRIPQMLEEAARQYAARFTAEELRVINAFYATGPGQKLIVLQPQLQEALSLASKKLGEDAGREAGTRAFEKMATEFGFDKAMTQI